MRALGLISRAIISSNDINSDQNIPNWHGTQPNIYSRRQSQDNYPFPPHQLSSLALKSTPTNVAPSQISKTFIGYPLISIRYWEPSLSDTKAPSEFYNIHRGWSNYVQPMPRRSEILSTDTRAFKLSIADPLKLSKILTPVFTPIRLREALAIWLIKTFYCLSFYICVTCAPFFIKINVTVAFSLSVFILQLISRTNPRKH